MPSITPTETPSYQPTPTPTDVNWQVIAHWLNTYDYSMEDIQLRYNNLQTLISCRNCALYCDDNTINIIGSKVNPSEPTHIFDIIINLIYPNNINLTSSLTTREGVFECRYLGTNDWYVLNKTFEINSIQSSDEPVTPDITTKVKTLLGICDPMTQNLGGRNGIFILELICEIIDPLNNDMSYFYDNNQIFEWNGIAANSDLILYLNVSYHLGI